MRQSVSAQLLTLEIMVITDYYRLPVIKYRYIQYKCKSRLSLILGNRLVVIFVTEPFVQLPAVSRWMYEGSRKEWKGANLEF